MFDVFAALIQRLEGAQIPYMIVGSIASIIYGEPRLTKDMDLVVDIAPTDARRFGRLFPLEEYYAPPPEVLDDEIVRRGQFNVLHHASGLKIDFVVRKNTAYARTEFSRRRKLTFWDSVEAFVAAPEDVIIQKLAYFREGGSEKHLLDIRGILSQTAVEHSYMQEWIVRLKLEDEWCAVSG